MGVTKAAGGSKERRRKEKAAFWHHHEEKQKQVLGCKRVQGVGWGDWSSFKLKECIRHLTPLPPRCPAPIPPPTSPHHNAAQHLFHYNSSEYLWVSFIGAKNLLPFHCLSVFFFLTLWHTMKLQISESKLQLSSDNSICDSDLPCSKTATDFK